MKLLIVVSCVIAAASAGLIHAPWAQLQHIPVIGPNGVPVEPAEVQIARAQHLAARAGHQLVPLDTPEVAAAKIQHAHDFTVAAQRNGVAVAPIAPIAPIAPVLLNHGAPIETPEVQLAKAAHHAAHVEARARLGGVIAPIASVAAVHAGIPAVAINGVPLDTPEVAIAKAQHLAAHAQAAHNSLLAPQWW